MKTTALRAVLEHLERGMLVTDEMRSKALVEVLTIERQQSAGLRRAVRALRGPVCVGVSGRCQMHDRPMGADLRCEVGRGGPLDLPEPKAQRTTKSSRRKR